MGGAQHRSHSTGNGGESMYAVGNPKTKKELREWIAEGRIVRAFLPNVWSTGFETQTDGETVIEGPHYPKPHRFYARVMLEDGIITRVIA